MLLKAARGDQPGREGSRVRLGPERLQKTGTRAPAGRRGGQVSGSREGWAVLIYNAEVSGEPESRLQRVKMRGWEGGEGCVAEAGLQGQRQDGVFLVDLVVFVKYFLFSPSVFFGKGMPACGKRNSHGEVVETPRMVPNKGIQPGRRLAFDVTPSRGCWAEGLFCPWGWLAAFSHGRCQGTPAP